MLVVLLVGLAGCMNCETASKNILKQIAVMKEYCTGPKLKEFTDVAAIQECRRQNEEMLRVVDRAEAPCANEPGGPEFVRSQRDEWTTFFKSIDRGERLARGELRVEDLTDTIDEMMADKKSGQK